MRSRTSIHKHPTRDTPKLERAKTRALSVTDGDVTRLPEESLAKRYGRLRPWIELANTVREGAKSLDPAPPQIAALMRAAGPRAFNPAIIVFSVLHDLARNRGNAHMRIDQEIASSVNLTCENGTVRVETYSPMAAFLETLEGVETARIRACPICNQIFYALRITQKACSRRCNQTRRVRAWREHQAGYEQNRKFKSAGVKPPGEAR